MPTRSWRMLGKNIFFSMSSALAEASCKTTDYCLRYSIYVLESSTSQRLTYFMPPLNLIPLLLLRPMRLFFPHQTVRKMRIAMLKATHFPFVMFILAYEHAWHLAAPRGPSPPSSTLPISPKTNRLGQNGLLGDTRSAPNRSPLLAGRTPASLSAPHTLDRQEPSAQDAPTTTAENVAELTVLVRRLTSQMDQLSSTVTSLPRD